MTIDEIKRQMFIDSEEVCGNTMIDTYSAQEYVERAYNKAIDDLMEKVSKCFISNAEWNYLVQEAEQLKAGGKNESIQM